MEALRVPVTGLVTRDTALTFDEAAPALFDVAYRVAYRLVSERTEAQDVAQEALIRAYKDWTGVHTYADRWVARVAANLALNSIRSRRRRSRREERDGREVIDLSERAHADPVLRVDLQRALTKLGRREREAVVLHYFADLTYDDIAELLGVSAGAVKSYVHRGVARLREQVGDLGGGRPVEEVS
jgi:RNA polymerase sigma-70 factor, ECF subfamily